MYLEHYGFDEQPFRLVPDTRRFFCGAQRGDVLAALQYAILDGEGIVKVVGEVGSGKTMLCRMLMHKLPASVHSLYIANPSISADNILNAIAFEAGIIKQPLSKLEVMHLLNQWLIQQHAQGRRIVVFIEEAQGMPLETLEELRLLSNLETEREKLLQIVLFGQPELDRNLEQTHIRQLRERIAHHFYLKPLTGESAYEYLNFRTQLAGYHGLPLFSKSAAKRMVKASGGLLRRMNLLADKILLATYADGLKTPRSQHIRMAIKDSHFRSSASRLLKAVAACSVIALLGVIGAAYASHLYQQTPIAIQSLPRQAIAETTVDIEPVAQLPEVLATDSLARSLQLNQAWLQEVATDQRSIQFISISQNNPELLRDYLQQLQAMPQIDARQIKVFASRLQGRLVYSVHYGNYDSSAAARAGIKALPVAFQQQGPYLVRSAQGIKDEMARSKS